MWVIAFRSGKYWDPGTEVSGAGVPLISAHKFASLRDAKTKASQWLSAGAIVVPLPAAR